MPGVDSSSARRALIADHLVRPISENKDNVIKPFQLSKNNKDSDRWTHTHTRLKRDEQADRQSTALVANESRQAVRK